MPSVGATLVAACRDPSSMSADTDAGSSESGDSSGAMLPGSSSGVDGTTSSVGSTDGSSGGDSSSDGSSEGSSSGDTGEAIDCAEQWWMCGNYGPLDDEHDGSGVELDVQGVIPPELDGLYVRNGPNPGMAPTGHWFLGDGMLHGVRLQSGTASDYRGRYVQTDVLGVPPGPIMGPPGLTEHQANTSVVSHAGRLFAISEVGLPYEVSPTDLSTVGPYDFGGTLAGPMTAHPKIDPVTGEMVFFGYHILEPAAHVHFVDPTGGLVRTEVIPLMAPTMMHDFQLTATHVVLLDFPIAFDFDLAIKGSPLPFIWQPKNGARFGVMPRNGTADDTVWFDTDLGFVFHTFNAFNDPMAPERIIVDAVYYSESWVEGPSDFETEGTVVRFIIDTDLGTVTRETIEDRQMEFPQIDPRRRGLPYRYGYAVGGSRPPGEQIAPADTLIKVDRQGDAVSHTLADGMQIDETIFIPASADAGEDEGFLLAYAYVPDRDVSRLLVFDATDITSGPMGSVGLPQRVPFGFHGTFVPS